MRDSRSSHGAGAALDFRHAAGIFADQLALGFWAVRFMAFPVALGFFTNGFALGFGSLAVSDAVRLFADSDALGAVEQLASFIRAFDLAFGFFALDIANGVFGLSATGVALGWLADWVANGRAVGVVALPGTLGVALEALNNSMYFGLHECGRNC